MESTREHDMPTRRQSDIIISDLAKSMSEMNKALGRLEGISEQSLRNQSETNVHLLVCSLPELEVVPLKTLLHTLSLVVPELLPIGNSFGRT